jgi:plasmid stabilization system protein ParE
MLDAIRAGHNGVKMTDRQAAIYNIILDLIYDGGGETPDDPAHVAAHLSNVGPAAARNAIQQLIDMGKLIREGSMLTQERARNESETQRKLGETRSVSGSLGGVSSGESRRNQALKRSKREQIREDIDKKEESPNGLSARARSVAIVDRPSTEAEFDKVWTHYPKKAGKAEARKAWAKARRSTEYEIIAVPLKAYIVAVSRTEVRFIVGLAVWLNQRRWEDENQDHSANRRSTSRDDLEALSRITGRDDINRLMGPQLRVIES